MKYVLPILILIPGYWYLISGKGFGGLWGLFLSPFAVILTVVIGPLLRKKLKIDARLHIVDFIGVALSLALAALLIPEIR